MLHSKMEQITSLNSVTQLHIPKWAARKSLMGVLFQKYLKLIQI